ncbi:septation protein SepH [Demequina zhanjiangensis]|uniref:Septation protein SepH n=1 Tax=Demequina zhanjiangensis TaxID=3051659 RepID=A0ABT8G127_9MICO|nr:septation protein SepH [Demequina sp. SYSU T00b26]MDN4472717.1 septation protein SepH [Demequina sp. SYSU T00b26]
MTELHLVGPADDEQQLILADADGREFRLAVTDELRQAVRHAAARARETAPSPQPASATMSPKEIQQRIRAGLSAAELAELTGEPFEALAKFEAPVIAEREYIVALARDTRIGSDAGAPILGDLVADRLAQREVDLDSLVWDAWRDVDEPWKVCVDFRTEGRIVRALWVFDHQARSLAAQDDESRWLTETELLDVPIPKRHLAAVRAETDAAVPLHPSRPAQPTAAEAEDESEAPSATELLLEDLAERRGTRESVPLDEMDDHDEDGGFEGFGPAAKARQAETGFGASKQAAPSAKTPATGKAPAAPKPQANARPSASAPSSASPRTPANGERRPRRSRASVPSWDEIVFGAKHD